MLKIELSAIENQLFDSLKKGYSLFKGNWNGF
jgi:hypothetical protein